MEHLHIFNTIDKLSSQYIDVWEDVCNIESPSNFKEGVDAVGAYFIALSKINGWKTERFPEERFGDVICITMNPDSDKAPIALSGHMDTVHPIGLFGSPAAHRDGDRLYGPGAMDCKGGVVAGFLAMHALSKCGYTDRPVMMLLQSNEEIGSGIENKAPIRRICEKAKNSVAFLNLEGHEGYFAGKACLERKGIAGFLFKITGVSTHASYCAREGASAITEAAHKIIELEKVKEENGLTFNCGIIKGGTVRNTVPGECEFQLDVRFSSESDFVRAKEIIDKVANTVYVPGCSCEAKMTNLRPAMEPCDRNLELLAIANSAFEKSGLSTLDAGKRTGGSDAADVTAFGIPCLDSLGVGGERAHSKDEYGVISSLAESAKRIAAIISAF